MAVSELQIHQDPFATSKPSTILQPCQKRNLKPLPNSELISKLLQIQPYPPNKLQTIKSMKLSNNASFQPLKQMVRLYSSRKPLKTINFGQCLPGHIVEKSFQIENPNNSLLICEVQTICLDQKLNELDEYIFSVRKNDQYNFNETQIVSIPPRSQTQLIVALKTPRIKKEQVIFGKIIVKAQGIEQQLENQLSVEVKIPKIDCQINLFSNEYQIPVIKIAMKLNQSLEFKIPFKNQSQFHIKTDLEIISNNTNDSNELKDIEFSVSPLQGLFPANSISFINLQVKVKENDRQKLKNTEKNLLLLIKIQNSSLIFCNPTIIEFY